MTNCKQRRGFTLVELLVVVAIIGILAGLIMVGGSAAFRAAREAATRMEMTNLERALEMYKTKYGEYPPDFSDYDAFVRHFKKRWPRVDVSAYLGDGNSDFNDPTKADKNTEAIRKAINEALLTPFQVPNDDAGNPDPNTFDANLKLSAIAFWLGGLPESGDATVLAGFGPSDNPFCFGLNASNKPSVSVGRDSAIFDEPKLREKPLYDFSTTLRNLPNSPTTDGYRCLISGKPVAYFRGTTLTTRQAKTHAYLQKPPAFFPAGYDPNFGTATENICKHVEFTWADGTKDEITPYALNTASSPSTTQASDTIDWHNTNSFQLIHPGADGRFSAPPATDCRPIAVTNEGQEGLTAEDLDNITNCGSSATVQGLIGK